MHHCNSFIPAQSILTGLATFLFVFLIFLGLSFRFVIGQLDVQAPFLSCEIQIENGISDVALGLLYDWIYKLRKVDSHVLLEFWIGINSRANFFQGGFH